MFLAQIQWFKAIYQSDIPRLDIIFKHYPNALLWQNTEDQFHTLIQIATKNALLKVFQFGIDSGADIRQKDFWGDTPLILAARQDDTQMLYEILKHLPAEFIDDYSSKGGRTALWTAIAYERYENLKLLLRAGACMHLLAPQAKHGLKQSILEWALTNNSDHQHSEIVQWLLSQSQSEKEKLTLENSTPLIDQKRNQKRL